MARVRLTRAARKDLIEIGEYTLDRWGDEQCVRYLTALDRRLRWLGRNARRGQPCDDLRPGYWRVREGRHVLFYRFNAETVEVIRILHERMLPRRHLGD
jgi:toxin ParE1/3/4